MKNRNQNQTSKANNDKSLQWIEWLLQPKWTEEEYLSDLRMTEDEINEILGDPAAGVSIIPLNVDDQTYLMVKKNAGRLTVFYPSIGIQTITWNPFLPERSRLNHLFESIDVDVI